MPKIMSSSSSDSSSDDECNIYVNAASKLNALNSKKKGQTRNKVPVNDKVIDLDEPKRLKSITSPVRVVESVSNDSSVKVQKPVQIIDSDDEDPVICIDDAECVRVNECIPKRTTRNSTKRKSKDRVTERLHDSEKFNDSIEEELNMLYDDSFNLSQEDNDDCVMIGSPELKRCNSDNTEVTIKVLWKSDQCHRFELGKNETFQKIFKSLANLEGISDDQVLITKKDKKITPLDTPASIGWSILDILDGGVVSAELVKKHKGNTGQTDASESGCKIKIQTSDKRTLTLMLKHDEPFSTLLKVCSQQLDIPESKIKFYFDGELIELNETPETLDIDDEACIDCKIAK